MKAFLKSYLSYSKSEKRGIVLLCILLLIIIVAPSLYRTVFHKEEQVDFSKLDQAVAAMEQAPIDNHLATASEKSYTIEPNHKLFVFDPNTANEAELLKLGFSNKLTHTLLNYRSKGGQFKAAGDLKKLYGMTDLLYQKLEAYVNIHEDKSSKEKSSYEVESHVKHIPKALSIVELNSADSISLLEIKGVGPAFASRILKYRELLGGYVQIEQLKEVYGMDSARYSAIVGQLRVNPLTIKKINVNKASPEVLRKHPYIRSFAIANALVNYRKQHGEYQKLDDIKKCLLIMEDLYNKFAPYIILH